MQVAPTAPLQTTCWRHIRHGLDPLSGAGARIQGGRWNPPNSFSVLYLATDQATVSREFQRLLTRQRLPPDSFLPRAMYSYEVELTALLDLRQDAARESVNLTTDDLRADDLACCQAVGEAAYSCRRSGILAPSATGQGTVVAVFSDCLTSDDLVKPGDYELWETTSDLPGAQ